MEGSFFDFGEMYDDGWTGGGIPKARRRGCGSVFIS